MANAEDERLSSEEGSTLEELRNKLARVNLPISHSKSVLMARLNRAYKAGQSAPKESERDEESANQRDLRSGQRAERDQDGDEDLEKLRTKELRVGLASLGLRVTGRKLNYAHGYRRPWKETMYRRVKRATTKVTMKKIRKR